ncbi:hypothetical protein HUJ05_006637 [Dendroctonus ponderosae]|nr:hypothetical protein HUJ05_006637 [Dendroctonus ponderosae]
MDDFVLPLKQDLYNIQRSFNLNNFGMRHKNDAISVDAWVNELKESESILYYKSQDSSSDYPGVKDEDFILIIMTPGQKELLLRFGNDCVCMDGTHGLNGYGFELHTLLVLDELREGYPGAFLISNKCDGAIWQKLIIRPGSTSCNHQNSVRQDHKSDEELNAILQAVSTSKTEAKLDADKKDFILTLMTYVNQCRTSEELDILKKLTAPFPPTLQAVRTNPASSSLLPSARNISTNKNVQPQRRIYSTRKVTKEKHKEIPTQNETYTLALQLLSSEKKIGS